VTPDDLDDLFADLIGQIDRLDVDALELMAAAYDRAGDVDRARELWVMAEKRRGSARP
jgi:Flp pilus assembly protein TadD